MAKFPKKPNTSDENPELENNELENEETSVAVAEESFDALVLKVRKEAMKLVVVTITSNDSRDQGSTAIYATCENQFFAKSRIVPLNTEVEIEQCLVDTLKEAKIVISQDEVIDGKRTGGSIAKEINKYNISYVK